MVIIITIVYTIARASRYSFRCVIAIITTINRIAIIATVNRIAIITTINRIAIITTRAGHRRLHHVPNLQIQPASPRAADVIN